MKPKWRLLFHPDLPGPRQMAIDEALYRSVNAGSPPVLRFYTWLRPTLSLGYFQNYKKVVCEPFCVDNSIDIVRRITGGRSVLHQYEMTYSVVAPVENCFANPSLQHSYQLISSALCRGLNAMGYRQTSISSKSASHDAGLPQCFVSVSKYEIADGFRKIIGSAQKRSRDRFLQHGSILLNFDLRLQNGCVNRPDSGITEKIAPLEPALGCRVDFAEISNVFAKAFEQEFQMIAEPSELHPDELQAMEQLELKYQSTEWTEGRWK